MQNRVARSLFLGGKPNDKEKVIVRVDKMRTANLGLEAASGVWEGKGTVVSFGVGFRGAVKRPFIKRHRFESHAQERGNTRRLSPTKEGGGRREDVIYGGEGLWALMCEEMVAGSSERNDAMAGAELAKTKS